MNLCPGIKKRQGKSAPLPPDLFLPFGSRPYGPCSIKIFPSVKLLAEALPYISPRQ